MLYLNIQDRKLPKGLYFGKDSRTTVLQIDSDFAKVKHYGVEIALKGMEVNEFFNKNNNLYATIYTSVYLAKKTFCECF